ncbi:MAG: CbiX/SirB N-terminal domain-containing protein [Erysipelotrichales bacterium]
MKGILILAHGSRRIETKHMMDNMMEMIKERNPETLIENAFMELCDPLLAVGLDNLVDAGATDITLIPYFLFEGIHIKEDIPGEINEYLEGKEGITVKMGQTIGADPRLADIISERIKEAK